MGASLIVAPKSWEALIDTLAEDKGLCVLMGIIVLLFSLTILVFHDDWTGTAPLLLSIIGVMGFIKAIAYLVVPGAMQKMISCGCWRGHWIWFYGFVAGGPRDGATGPVKESKKVMIEIKNLHASVDGTEILKGINLTIEPGKVHAVMGPNGAGKSTLSYVIAGREGYDVTEGEILFNGANIHDMKPEGRAAAGLFLAFQYPVEIPGVQMTQFLKTAINAVHKARGEEELDAIGFLRLMKTKCAELNVSEEMMKRPVNVGFSGGEKKRAEILQMAMLAPKFAVLDETDSGLDIDALKVVADGVNALRAPERSFLVITHYQRLLDYIVPDVVHVLADGRIAKTGGKELALELEEKGYADITGEAA